MYVAHMALNAHTHAQHMWKSVCVFGEVFLFSDFHFSVALHHIISNENCWHAIYINYYRIKTIWTSSQKIVFSSFALFCLLRELVRFVNSHFSSYSLSFRRCNVILINFDWNVNAFSHRYNFLLCLFASIGQSYSLKHFSPKLNR